MQQENIENKSTVFGPGSVVAVQGLQATGTAYDYRVSAELTVRRGDIVRVPLGRREVTGVVWGPGESALPPEKIKEMIGLVGDAALPPDLVTFIDWMAGYTLADRGAVLKLALPVDAGEGTPKKSTRGKPLGGTAPDPDHHVVDLTSTQMDGARELVGAVERGGYETWVLDGVTGAGKTEVYFEAVASALKQGKQVLILQPEIALTTTFTTRFEKRFGQAPALWHSGLTPAQRRKTFTGIMDGSVRVVAGARSALMLPYQNLGLIIIDEEHDGAYKQEEGVIYHARDMAVARAHLSKFPVILASATPSLETMVNVWSGRYKSVKLPARFGKAEMPQIDLIDLKTDKPDKGNFIAPTLYRAIGETLARQEQILLFLNRRGYAPLTLCRTCGHRFMCPRCTAWMVAHRRTGRLHCHHCGYDMNVPKACPSCGDTGSLVACGPGVERIEEEVKLKYPDARTLILSSDLMDHPNEMVAAFDRVEARQVDIIVGTQMIAKGHHFPDLTLVGVVDADLGLAGGDLRAAERTFQLLQQVSGRAGRADKPGRVFLQTFMPENKVMQAIKAGGRDLFLEIEAQERQGARMPPFSRLVGVIVSGKDEELVKKTAQDLAKIAPHATGVVTWGPAEAPLYRVRGRYRMRFLVQADRQVAIQKAVAEWISRVNILSSIDVRIDIDPQTFL